MSVTRDKDAVFVLSDGSSLSAHRSVLAEGSPVFQAMFYGTLPQGEEEEIPVPDVDPSAFRALICYFYANTVDVNEDSALPLLYAARKYEVSGVRSACVAYLKAGLDTDTALWLLDQAVFYDEEGLLADCLEVIINDAPSQLVSEDWLQLSLEGLSVVLRENRLAVPESDVYAAARRWAQARCREKSMPVTPGNEAAVLGRALSLIRFPLLGPAVLADGLLSREQTAKLLLHINGVEESSGFSASPRRNPDILCRLLNLGLEEYEVDEDYSTNIAKLLTLEAALEGDIEALETCLSAGIPVAKLKTRKGLSFLKAVVVDGQAEAIRVLARFGVDFQAPVFGKCSALHWACREGYTEAAAALLEAGLSIEARDDGKVRKTPLMLAANNGRQATVRLLLQKGADVTAVNDSNHTALHYVDYQCWGHSLKATAKDGPVVVIRALLAAGADVNALTNWRRTPLHWAAEEGEAAAVRALLDAGAAVNAADREGRTALHRASRRCHAEVVRLLLEAGADVNAVSQFETALHMACVKGEVSVLRALLEAGADVSAKDEEGNTALHVASRWGHAEGVEALLAAGADVVAADKLARTPLHWAAQRGHLDVAQGLLAAGASRTARASGGRTPLEEARDRGHRGLVDLMQEYRQGRVNIGEKLSWKREGWQMRRTMEALSD